MNIYKNCNPPRTTSARDCRRSWKEAVMSVFPSPLTIILSRLMIMLAAAWIIATGSPAMAADVAIQGQVRSLDGTPIHMIKVSVYRDLQLVERDYTDAEGKYAISVPAGEPITVRFDTHPTLTNAREWHPSVVANLETENSISLDRLLLKVGTTRGETADLDALAAYQFAAMWTAARVDSGSHNYGKEAAARLSMMKFTNDALLEIQQALITYFEKLE